MELNKTLMRYLIKKVIKLKSWHFVGNRTASKIDLNFNACTWQSADYRFIVLMHKCSF